MKSSFRNTTKRYIFFICKFNIIYKVKTILLKQIDGAIYMDSWLENIGYALRWQPMNIWIGFSFLMKCQKENETKIIYWYDLSFKTLIWFIFSYAARELSFVKARIHTEEEFDKLRAKFDEYTELDFLKSTFVNNQEENVFHKSGFLPYKTVCAYVWIRK